jgi:hypothetical protein
MLLCPPHIQTSPKRTSVILMLPYLLEETEIVYVLVASALVAGNITLHTHCLAVSGTYNYSNDVICGTSL